MKSKSLSMSTNFSEEAAAAPNGATRMSASIAVIPRRMRLTAELASRVTPCFPEPGSIPAQVRPTDADYQAMATALLSERPASGEVWVFAYGSLLWKPAFAIAEERPAVARGWHRSFRLGWDYRYRGSPKCPGLMLALDRGGTCKGILQRLPSHSVEASLRQLLHREVVMKPSPFPPRWIKVATANGSMRAITFAMDPKSDFYVSGLSDEHTADVLAAAVGQWGSMAEYLHNTVAHLQHLGIADRFLWRMQRLVAERIEARFPSATAEQPLPRHADAA
jgi:cation transport protein ChaC